MNVPDLSLFEADGKDAGVGVPLPTVQSPTPGEVEVRALGSLDELTPFAETLDRLNLEARRPSPFAALPYIRAFVASDEYDDGSYRPLLLVALSGGQPIGWVPLRRRRVKTAGVPSTLIEFLVAHDNERPELIARPADEERCAAAFLDHLVHRERGWSHIELIEQDAASPLARVAERVPGFWVRRFENNPNGTIQVKWQNGGEYYRALSKNFRKALRNGLNRLFAQGKVEFVSSWDTEATNRLLDIHLEIEGRSWKGEAAAGISRHQRRVAFFRSLLAPSQPMKMSFRALLLDGVPIASECNGDFHGAWYSFEGTYDESFYDYSPGHFLFLMSMREALAMGARSVNLLNNYAYAKQRFLADITPTAAVQIYRPATLPWTKARLGDLKRRLVGKPTGQADVAYNLAKPRAENEGTEAAATLPDRSRSRAFAAEVLASCASKLERVDGAALLEMIRDPSVAKPKGGGKAKGASGEAATDGER